MPTNSASTRPGFMRMLGRASLLRCPNCGNHKTFLRGWFRRYDRCRTCGIRWQRETGFEIGAVSVNTVMTFGTLAVAMAIGFVLTAPDIPVLPFVLSLSAVALLMPVIIYPFTFTIWLAVDLMSHPADEAELDEAAAAVTTPPLGTAV